MERVRARLEKLERRVAKGQIKAAEKIGAAAARILGRNHGHRYYDWSCVDGVFRFFEHPAHFAREQAYEGKYVIQTEEPGLSATSKYYRISVPTFWRKSHPHISKINDLAPANTPNMSNMG
jgi:hypothetical protein